MTAMYSLWLMPEPDSARLLQARHERLSHDFGAARFDLHLTLLGGRNLELARLKSILPAIAAGIAPFEAAVQDVRTSDLFFQSFYALFAAEGPILTLKDRAMRLAVDEGVSSFMPHVSLLYGPVEPEAKARAAHDARGALTGLPVRFDAVAIAYSSDTVPIADWRIEAAIRLG